MSITELRFIKTVSMPERRIPPPWSVQELDACFVVKDGSGQNLSSTGSVDITAGGTTGKSSRPRR
jgi:hypothetical protein